MENLDMDNIFVLGMAAVVTVSTQIVSMYLTSGHSTVPAGRYYAIIACIVSLLFQFGLFERSRLRRENERIEQLFATEERQHNQSKENIELINRKCHDLKHQIAAIRSMTNDEQREESLKEMESAVFIYESDAKTGNDTLDVVLTEKSLQCEKHKIKFEYMVDGCAINFMRPVDCYTLFGNMLDNAIESVIQQTDPEKRIISLTVMAKNNIVSIHMENYCEDTIIFENGLPVTTKKDKNYHGFGMKSIKFLAERYGGNLVISNENKLFIIDIMIVR